MVNGQCLNHHGWSEAHGEYLPHEAPEVEVDVHARRRGRSRGGVDGKVGCDGSIQLHRSRRSGLGDYIPRDVGLLDREERRVGVIDRDGMGCVDGMRLGMHGNTF